MEWSRAFGSEDEDNGAERLEAESRITERSGAVRLERSKAERLKRSKAKDNESKRSGVFGSGAKRRIINRGKAECLQDEQSGG